MWRRKDEKSVGRPSGYLPTFGAPSLSGSGSRAVRVVRAVPLTAPRRDDHRETAAHGPRRWAPGGRQPPSNRENSATVSLGRSRPPKVTVARLLHLGNKKRDSHQKSCDDEPIAAGTGWGPRGAMGGAVPPITLDFFVFLCQPRAQYFL